MAYVGQNMSAEAQYPDATFMAGRIAQEVNDSSDVWVQTGANWAVSRTLICKMETEVGGL